MSSELKTNKQIIKLLEEAKAKISDPENWTKGCWARDIDGTEVDYESNLAKCFCSIGALYNVGNTDPYDSFIVDRAEKYLQEISLLNHGAAIIEFNDRETTTHESVMEMFNLAIRYLKEARNE